MCGIAGVASAVEEAFDVARARTSLECRGPDGTGFAEPLPGTRFVHTRLAINDLSPAGMQPISGEDGSVTLIFNGEIYNAPELRRRCEAAGHRFTSDMDGEVIVHLWEMYGAAALDCLNGIFAVAVADRRTGEVVLARDPLGVKPLFYAVAGSSLWFASELRALAAAGAPVGGHDVVALAQFLTFLWVPDPRSPFEGAHALPPGHLLRWTKGGIGGPTPYATPLVPREDPEPISKSVAAGEFRERFTAAARRQLLADTPIGLMASGGIDSGLLWSATSESLDAAFTVTWSERDDEEGLSSEVFGVAELAQRFGTKVHEVPGDDVALEGLPRSGDLFADPAYHLTRSIARAARSVGIPVLLSGQGGDELFGGYRRHRVAKLLSSASLAKATSASAGLARRLSRRSLSGEYASRLRRAAQAKSPFERYLVLCSYSTARQRAELLGCSEAEVSDAVVWQRHREVFDALPPRLSFLRKTMTVDLQVYLPGLGLAYVDRAGMEFGVEIRVPWLDLSLARWALTLPDDCLATLRSSKILPRAVARDDLGAAYAMRPKRGFGAPAGKLPSPNEDASDYRQGRYLRHAMSVLSRFRSTPISEAS